MKKQCILVGMLAASLSASNAWAQHQTPKDQPGQAPEAEAPAGDLVLGSVRLPKGVMADGKPLPAGTYQVRLTAQEAGPPAVGVTEKLERWVEFVQGGAAKGREVASILPAAEAKLVAKDAPPPANGVKLQTLKGGDYMRVWFNKGGNHYLIYFPVAAPAMK
jgi:hypothetical protein